MNTIKFITLASIIIFLFLAQVILAQNFKSIEGKTTVMLDGYSVKSPSGDGWECMVYEDKKTVFFRDESSNFLTGDENKTYIRVSVDSVNFPENESDEKTAGEYLNGEYKKIIGDLKKGLTKEGMDEINIDFELKFDTVIAGMKLYAKAFSLSYSPPVDILGIHKCYIDYLLFVYLPENINVFHSLFLFDISSSYNQPNLLFNTNSSNLKPIFKIIKNFKIEEKTK